MQSLVHSSALTGPLCAARFQSGACRCRPHVAAHAKRRGGASTSSVSEGLLTVLKDELKIERERYRQSEELMEGPPEPFEVQFLPSRNLVTLTRQFKNEDILVEVDLDVQDSDEGDEEYEDEDVASMPVRFSLNVVKGDAMMVFECESNGEYIIIKHLSLDDDNDEEEGLTSFPAYRGPVFDELDTTLQQAFQDFLEERGVTAELAEYLMELVNDKLEVEYMSWLERVQKFITKKS